MKTFEERSPRFQRNANRVELAIGSFAAIIAVLFVFAFVVMVLMGIANLL